jgi:hypothetical protein
MCRRSLYCLAKWPAFTEFISKVLALIELITQVPQMNLSAKVPGLIELVKKGAGFYSLRQQNCCLSLI